MRPKGKEDQTMSDYPEIRRVVTAHDANGKAIVLFDSITPHKHAVPNGPTSHGLWVTETVPAAAVGAQDRFDAKLGIPPPRGGTIFTIVDFSPEGDVRMDGDMTARQRRLPPEHMHQRAWPPRHPSIHRTRTVDYAIVLAGEIDMLLDDSERHLKTGDVVIQQATNHAWVNRGTEPCRMAFVLIDAIEPLG
jgi:mannose-6-phosphate isomerase-like protein (cupin superfamily)